MIIGFVIPPDIKDMMPNAAGREVRPLPETEEELESLIKKAEAGDRDAQCDLGCFYRAQADTKLEHFRNAIPSGSPNMRAPYNVDERPPFFEVVEEDRRNAFKWFQKSAEQGNIDAVYYLSLCYERGEGTAKHLTKARELLQKAAELGQLEAQYDLGMLYYHGVKNPHAQTFEFPQDHGRAVTWLAKAAEQGDSLAQYQLALCYEEGTGAKQDFETAFHWYSQAAEAELVWAILKLGECFETGRGTVKDEVRAVELYRRAAELGDTDGMCNLARCYENGVGVEIDLDKAIEWYQAAADNGDEQAFDALDRLKEE